jgi:hypothetical protein
VRPPPNVQRSQSPPTQGAGIAPAPVLMTQDAHLISPCRWCGAELGQLCYVVQPGELAQVVRVPSPHLVRVEDARQLLRSR